MLKICLAISCCVARDWPANSLHTCCILCSSGSRVLGPVEDTIGITVRGAVADVGLSAVGGTVVDTGLDAVGGIALALKGEVLGASLDNAIL